MVGDHDTPSADRRIPPTWTLTYRSVPSEAIENTAEVHPTACAIQRAGASWNDATSSNRSPASAPEAGFVAADEHHVAMRADA